MSLESEMRRQIEIAATEQASGYGENINATSVALSTLDTVKKTMGATRDRVLRRIKKDDARRARVRKSYEAYKSKK